VARRATKIGDERKVGGSVLVLDAGNSLTGDRDPARISAGATSIEAMNLLGYDAMALGPMDLALGPEVLRQRMAEAKFPLLSANAIDRETGKLLAKPFVVLEIGAYRVAIVGISGRSDADGITVSDPLAAAREVAATVRSQSDELIVLSNAGTSVDQQIADAVPGITAIVEGGEGALSEPWVSGLTKTLIFHADEASAGHAGRILGIARLTLDRNGSLADYSWQRFPLGPEVADDAAVATWVTSKTGG
jgi:2',3'-cyclic-nucleotide 2'-phosphodiesterase (5'-nucleotidase family)